MKTSLMKQIPFGYFGLDNAFKQHYSFEDMDRFLEYENFFNGTNSFWKLATPKNYNAKSFVLVHIMVLNFDFLFPYSNLFALWRQVQDIF